MYRILSPYANEVAALVWSQAGNAYVEHVELPLGLLTGRTAHDLDPVSYLRFGGAIFDAGSDRTPDPQGRFL